MEYRWLRRGQVVALVVCAIVVVWAFQGGRGAITPIAGCFTGMKPGFSDGMTELWIREVACLTYSRRSSDNCVCRRESAEVFPETSDEVEDG